MEFSEARKTKRVNFALKDGTKKKFMFVEMMSDGVAEWQKYKMTRVKLNRDGVPDVNRADMKDHNAKLVSMCLYNEDGTELVPIGFIHENFPASMLNQLFDYCETANGLNEKGRDEAKKD